MTSAKDLTIEIPDASLTYSPKTIRKYNTNYIDQRMFVYIYIYIFQGNNS